MRLELNLQYKVFTSEVFRYGMHTLGRIYGSRFVFEKSKFNLWLVTDHRLWDYIKAHEDARHFFVDMMVTPDMVSGKLEYFMTFPVRKEKMFTPELAVIWDNQEVLRFTNIKLPGEYY